MKNKVSIFLVLFPILCFSTASRAEIFKVAIMEIPEADHYKKLFTALEEITGNTFELKVYPPARANAMIVQKRVNIQAPRIRGKDEAYNRTLKFDFAAERISTVPFVLYTNKYKPIDIEILRKGNAKGYRIETDSINLKQFGFNTIASFNTELSFKNLARGRIDGYINSQHTGDAVLNTLKLTSIHRQLWDEFDSCITIRKGQAGGKLDNILSEGIKKLKASGKLKEIMEEDIRRSKYDDWQP